MTEIKPLTYKNMHGEITLHPCYTRDENGQIVPMTTTGGHQLYAMPGGAKHTERKLDVIMWDKYGRAKQHGVKDPKAVTLDNGAIKWVFEHHLDERIMTDQEQIEQLRGQIAVSEQLDLATKIMTVTI